MIFNFSDQPPFKPIDPKLRYDQASDQKHEPTPAAPRKQSAWPAACRDRRAELPLPPPPYHQPTRGGGYPHSRVIHSRSPLPTHDKPFPEDNGLRGLPLGGRAAGWAGCWAGAWLALGGGCAGAFMARRGWPAVIGNCAGASMARAPAWLMLVRPVALRVAPARWRYLPEGGTGAGILAVVSISGRLDPRFEKAGDWRQKYSPMSVGGLVRTLDADELLFAARRNSPMPRGSWGGWGWEAAGAGREDRPTSATGPAHRECADAGPWRAQ
jgi:hypothetical protein